MLDRVKQLPTAVKMAVPLTAAAAVGAVSVLAIGGSSASTDPAVTAPAPVAAAAAAVRIDDDRLDRWQERNPAERHSERDGTARFFPIGAAGDRDGRAFGGPDKESRGLFGFADEEGLEARLEAELEGLAGVVGTTADELKARLESGDALAAIAAENGVEAQAVIDYVTERANSLLDEAVSGGMLTSAQAERVRGMVADEASAFVNEGFDEEDGAGLWWNEQLAGLAGVIGITAEALEAELEDGGTLAQIAADNGVEAQAVIDHMTAQAGAMLDEAVAEGELSTAQAESMRAKLAAKIAEFVHEGFDAFERDGHGRFGGGREHGDGMSELNGLAEAAGTDAQGLMSGFQAGKSLADIARENGVEPQAVIDYLTAELDERLDRAVESGKITRAQADEYRAEALPEITAGVEGTKDELFERGGRGKGPRS